MVNHLSDGRAARVASSGSQIADRVIPYLVQVAPVHQILLYPIRLYLEGFVSLRADDLHQGGDSLTAPFAVFLDVLPSSLSHPWTYATCAGSSGSKFLE